MLLLQRLVNLAALMQKMLFEFNPRSFDDALASAGQSQGMNRDMALSLWMRKRRLSSSHSIAQFLSPVLRNHDLDRVLGQLGAACAAVERNWGLLTTASHAFGEETADACPACFCRKQLSEGECGRR
jgi:hypothetical protein